MLDKIGPRWRLPVLMGGAAVLIAAGALAALLINSHETAGLTQIDGTEPAPQENAAPLPIGDMVLERQFHGPLKDTVIQRWRDPADGTICYLYLPILVQHSPPAANGMVQYGANGIGSIGCLPARR